MQGVSEQANQTPGEGAFHTSSLAGVLKQKSTDSQSRRGEWCGDLLERRTLALSKLEPLGHSEQRSDVM